MGYETQSTGKNHWYIQCKEKKVKKRHWNEKFFLKGEEKSACGGWKQSETETPNDTIHRAQTPLGEAGGKAARPQSEERAELTADRGARNSPRGNVRTLRIVLSY